jgi:hypothetical protein
MEPLLLPTSLGLSTHVRITVQDGSDPTKTAGFIYSLGYFQPAPTLAPVLSEEGITIQPPDQEPVWIETQADRWTYCPQAGDLSDDEAVAFILEHPSDTPPAPPAPPPDWATARQVLLAMARRGVFEEQIEDVIRSVVTDPTAQKLALLEFRKASGFDRSHPLTQAVGRVFNLNIDDLYREAANL